MKTLLCTLLVAAAAGCGNPTPGSGGPRGGRLRLPHRSPLASGVRISGLSLTAAAERPSRRAVESTFVFSERLIARDYGYAFGLARADLDRDGDLDFTSADAIKNSLSWFENDGHGHFRRHTIQRDEPGWFERHAVGDIDRDGHLDIVVVKNLHGEVVWFRNQGAPRDAASWSRHLISDRLPGAYDVTLGDFDGDGDLDVAASSWIKGKRFEWFENDGSPRQDAWRGRIIEGSLNETREVCAADLDADGDTDLLATATADDLLLWYENSGAPAVDGWKRHVIDAQTRRPVHGEAADLDRDGDLDVLMAFGSFSPSDVVNSHQVAWYENRSGRFTKHAICKLVNATEVVSADFDGDGDLDLVACAWGAETGKVVCIENRNLPAAAWIVRPLKRRWPKASGVLTGDFDGDGRPDIVGSAERGSNEIRCWLQRPK